MTYCAALLVDEGLVFASDTRTNAGVDYVTTFSKMHIIRPAPDRVFVLLSAGNLATTQEVLNRINRDLEQGSDGPNLMNADYLFEAAEYVGKICLAVQGDHGPALQASGVNADTTLILGGQIAPHIPKLFQIYPQGNYFAASEETPYLQIGETKYGKPVLDRISRSARTLANGARLLLVSLDAASRSNAAVGPPFEIALYRADTFEIGNYFKLEADDPWLRELQKQWNQGISNAFFHLPQFPWEQAQAQVSVVNNS
jgi:putative proteasome-type protease